VTSSAYRAERQVRAVDITRSRIADGRSGITLIELLVVIAIIGIIAGLGAISGRVIARNASERAVLNTVQQAVWQGATLAAARGFETELCWDGVELAIRRGAAEACTGAMLRGYEVAASVAETLEGLSDVTPIVFTPPGMILEGTRPGAITLDVAGSSYVLEVSLIGEVRVQ
jgi:prepilin-type N-terminal cleavage/methylation domain-containing protein